MTTVEELLKIDAQKNEEHAFNSVQTVLSNDLNRLETPFTWSSMWDKYYSAIRHNAKKYNGWKRPVWCNEHYGKSCFVVHKQMYYRTGFWAVIPEATAREFGLTYTDENGEEVVRTVFHMPLFAIPLRYINGYGRMVDRYDVPIIQFVDVSEITDYQPLPFDKHSKEWKRIKRAEKDVWEYACKESSDDLLEAVIFFIYNTQ